MTDTFDKQRRVLIKKTVISKVFLNFRYDWRTWYGSQIHCETLWIGSPKRLKPFEYKIKSALCHDNLFIRIECSLFSSILSVHVVCGNLNFHEYNPGTRTHEFFRFSIVSFLFACPTRSGLPTVCIMQQ